MNISVKNLFTLEECIARDIFEGVKYPWEVIARIKDFLIELSKGLPDDFEQIEEYVWVGKGTTLEKTALIKGPAIIGYDCDIRHCAYVRENVIVGNEVVIGNSTEIKNSILFNRVQVPHFNYMGDSILGYKAHLGAGAILSNVKSSGETVRVKVGADSIDTGLRKFGALIGDEVEIGCNSVLYPGTIIGRESTVYPLTSVRGYLPEKQILKNIGEAVPRR